MPGVSDSNLLDIDDLLYPGFSMPNPSVTQPTKLIQKIINESLTMLSRILSEIGQSYKDFHPVLWMAYLQLLEHISYKQFCYNSNHGIIYIVRDLLHTMNVKKICIALKILRITFSKNNKSLFGVLEEDIDRNIIFEHILFKLKNIPQARHPNNKRITAWMSQQSAIIIDSLKSFNSHYNKILKFQNLIEKENIEDSMLWLNARCFNDIKKVWTSEIAESVYVNSNFWIWYSTCVPDHIYEIFMLARNEDKKLELQKYFYEGIMKVFDRCPKNKTLSPKERFYGYCHVFKEWVKDMLLRYIRVSIWFSGCTDNELEEIAKRTGFNIETFSTGNLDETINIFKRNEKLCQSVVIDDEFDYTITKYLVFNDFKRRVQLVTICYTQLFQSKQLKEHGFDDNFESCIFRNNEELIFNQRLIRSALLDPSKRNTITWCLRIVMQKCPFVFLPKYFIHLMPDLLRALKGEEVDEITMEEIFLALGDCPEKCRFEEDD